MIKYCLLNITFLKFRNPLQPIADWVSEPMGKVVHITTFIPEPTLIFWVKAIIAVFFVSALVVFCMVIFRRIILLRQKEKAKVLKTKFEVFLSELMSNIDENGKIFYKKNFNTQLSKKDTTDIFHRKVLLDEMLIMRHHVGGFEAEKLKELYLKLGFDKDALQQLKNKRWYRRLEAVQAISLMEVDGFNEVFQMMAVDEHQLVRVAALRALILRGGNWQQALTFYNYNLSLWEQYQICDALSRRQSIELPDFSPLLQSVNRSVTLFALKLIKQFHCLENVEQAEPYLLSQDEDLKKAAQEIMIQFGLDFEIEEKDLEIDDLSFKTLNLKEIHILEDAYALKGGTQLNETLVFEILE
jgi:hypothetical protein